MTLQQLSSVKHWLIAHHRRGTLEYRVWDAILTGWVMGSIGAVPSLLLMSRVGVAASLAMYFLPRHYVSLRRRLHQRGTLRCDWLSSAQIRA